MKRIFDPGSTRFCMQHREHAPIKGGAYQVSKDGKHQRWQCAECIAKKEARINGL